MEYTSLIFPGDKIDIFASGLSDNSTSYKSSFSDKLTDSMWEITMPVDSGRVVLFQLGTQFDFIIYTQNKTILKSSAIVRQRYRKENMYFLAIELINNLEKIQRRQFFRLPCTIDMDFYEVRYDDKAESELEFCKKMYKNHAINSKNMNTVKSVILDNMSLNQSHFSINLIVRNFNYSLITQSPLMYCQDFSKHYLSLLPCQNRSSPRHWKFLKLF